MSHKAQIVVVLCPREHFDTAACLLTFNSSHGHEPTYISEMLIPRTIHYGLRSQNDLTLVMPGDFVIFAISTQTGLCDATLWYNIVCTYPV